MLITAFNVAFGREAARKSLYIILENSLYPTQMEKPIGTAQIPLF